MHRSFLQKIVLNYESTPFSLDYTLDCGQVFRWEKKGNYWYGVVGETIIKLGQDQEGIIFQTFPEERGVDFIQRYFRLDDELPRVVMEIDKDPTIRKAIDTLYGLRIIRQDPWECLISYICATFSNISRIRRMVQNLSRKFGESLSCDGFTFYTFPRKEVLAKATLEELLDCGLGFRAKYVREASKMVVKDCGLEFEDLKRSSYREAKGQLLSFPGVGPKVADCILLFSLDKLEAFPVDVWVKRIVSRYYSQHFLDDKLLRRKGLTTRDYEQFSAFGREYFGEYAGYAQEYLFYYYRLFE